MRIADKRVLIWGFLMACVLLAGIGLRSYSPVQSQILVKFIGYTNGATGLPSFNRFAFFQMMNKTGPGLRLLNAGEVEVKGSGYSRAELAPFNQSLPPMHSNYVTMCISTASGPWRASFYFVPDGPRLQLTMLLGRLSLAGPPFRWIPTVLPSRWRRLPPLITVTSDWVNPVNDIGP